MKTAAVYIRVSTDEQAEYSPDSQLAEAKAYAARNGMIISPDHVYTDVGISGRKANKRPAFMRMVAEAKGKPSPFDVILVWKFSRFARNQEESILYKNLLKKECNVEVVSISEEVGDSVFGSLIERIIEWMDEFYSIRLSEEVTTKMTFAAERGQILSIAPFGYSKKPDQPMVIVPEEAEWIKYIFESFVSGSTMVGLAKELNSAGVRTHRGNLFENRTIEYILHNPMYCGYVRWTPTGVTVGKRIYDSPDTIVKKGDFEPIISEELFNKAKERLAEISNRHKKRAKPVDVKKHWLSGLVKCSSCGSSMSYAQATAGFQCHKYARGLCSESHYISAKKLEAAVISSIEQVTVTDSFVKDITRIKKEDNAIDYGPQIARLESMLERAKKAYAAGIDTLEEYGSNKKRIIAEIDDLKAKDAAQTKETVYLPVPEVQNRFDGLVSLLKSDSDVVDKHRAAAGIIDHIVFNRKEESLEVFFYL